MVSGTIAESTTWTRDGSPYLLVGETKIANAATLTIESGVVVEAQGRYVIEVAGTVDANGTADAPVRFSCIRYVPQCWFGFDVVPSGVLSLDHSEVAFAGAGVESAKGKVAISNSRVHHNGTGLRLGGAEVTSTLVDYNNTGVEVTAPFTSFDKNTITVEKRGKKPESRSFSRHAEIRTEGDLVKDARVTVYYREQGGQAIAHRVIVKPQNGNAKGTR